MSFKIAKISVDKVVEQLESEFGRETSSGRLDRSHGGEAPRPIAGNWTPANENSKHGVIVKRRNC